MDTSPRRIAPPRGPYRREGRWPLPPSNRDAAIGNATVAAIPARNIHVLNIAFLLRDPSAKTMRRPRFARAQQPGCKAGAGPGCAVLGRVNGGGLTARSRLDRATELGRCL